MFSRNRPDRDDRGLYRKYWSGRGGRAEYWITVACVIGLGALFPGMSSTAATGPLLIFTIRRLHDFDRTGWWAALPFGFGLACGIGMLAVPAMAGVLQAVLLVASVSFTAFVGFMPGDPGQNRYGAPQVLFRRKGPDLGETFG
ncbi:DUF805 domain-containing protein [Phenylobacterium sp.]|uniref:DUF805 domain-containing protein n=1 Tax=Phenylobacterium sp. TaxID=1871053 RepID=UPI0025E98B97|nr:DUF805 domain-containing protein [Phenylobacterium sp.]